MRASAFWDASALVPLCLTEPLTKPVLSLYQQYDAVVWWGTPVEIASASARLLRLRKLKLADWTESKQRAHRLARWWTIIPPNSKLLDKAVEIVEHYDLRAADSLQLAAAMLWCEGRSRDRVFVSADQRLRDAALLCGFDAPQLQ